MFFMASTYVNSPWTSFGRPEAQAKRAITARVFSFIASLLEAFTYTEPHERSIFHALGWIGAGMRGYSLLAIEGNKVHPSGGCAALGERY
jgi:hypothetical protein